MFVGVAAKDWPTPWSAAARHSDEVVDGSKWTTRSNSDLERVGTAADRRTLPDDRPDESV